MEAFSEGVFAIAITLLVLEIGVPDGSEDDLLGALVEQWPSYLGYLVSFATIGALWIKHSAVTDYLTASDARLVRLNLLLLLAISFLPFPTRLLAEYVGEPDAARVAAVVYGINLLLASALMSLLWKYAVRQRLVREDLSEHKVKGVVEALGSGMAAYVALIFLGLFLPVAAVVGYLVIALYILVPVSALRSAR